MIKFENSSYYYSRKTPFETKALSAVSLEIRKGEVLAVMGRTGSGKSTLSQLATGLLLPTEGSVEVDAMNTGNKKARFDITRKTGIVFQYPEAQFFSPTVYEEIAFALKNFGITDDIQRRVREVLTDVGLDVTYLERNPFKLSGGEQRLVAIASTIVWNPDYIFFDEPTAGLDAKGKKRVKQVITTLAGDNRGVVVVTHDMTLVRDFFEKLAVMSDGELVFYGDKKEFFRDEKLMKETGIFDPFRYIS
ncbi:MAG TPA: ATP-binding cassette domain-containing protein [Thermotogota bacterium]|nr:ATP-binding cassette domain-containing protein [Thermotogota bacterium]HPR95440.1 ATP-binding cassette domain-containing protein [Thermotogota bacterium]